MIISDMWYSMVRNKLWIKNTSQGLQDILHNVKIQKRKIFPQYNSLIDFRIFYLVPNVLIFFLKFLWQWNDRQGRDRVILGLLQKFEQKLGWGLKGGLEVRIKSKIHRQRWLERWIFFADSYKDYNLDGTV